MGKIVNPHQIREMFSGIISYKKQFEEIYVDLTISKLFRIKTAGRIDFGGSEFESGQLEPIPPVKLKPEDAYGWWELHEGYFLLEYNEKVSLPNTLIAFLQPHPHLTSTGCVHPSLAVHSVNEELKVPLWVPKLGVKIKQNARISRMIIIEL